MSGQRSTGAQRIAQRAAELDVGLAPEAADQLARYVALLRRWSRRVDLIAPGDEEDAIDRHIADSLGLLRLLDAPDLTARARAWVDVGSGGGLPGLVLAIARPSLEWTLLEPRERRVAFLHHAVGSLEVANASVVRGRLEDLGAGAFDGALSRATFAPARWLEVAQRPVRAGGVIVCMMGGDPDDRVVAGAWRVDRFDLPQLGTARTNTLHEVRSGEATPEPG